MTLVIFSTLLALLGQSTAGTTQHRTLTVPEVGTMLYGISVPSDYDRRQPLPLVLALHPGGANGQQYYGATFMTQIFSPALGDLHAIVVAPDCPGRDWTNVNAERSVMALMQSVLDEYAIDRRRILVTGFSMGGRGTWFMSARHADLFTAAIVVAGSAGTEPLDRLGVIPTYVIHSRADQVVPFEPAEQTARALEKMGRPVRFEPLDGLGHFQMGGYVPTIRKAGQWVAERWAK